jgi:hypothetical protein
MEGVLNAEGRDAGQSTGRPEVLGVGGVRSGGEFGNLSALIKLNISGGGVGIAP